MDKRTCKRTIASLHILRDIALVVSYPGCRSFLRRGWSFPAVIRLPSHFIISSPSSRGTPQTGTCSSAPRKKKKPRTGGALRRRLQSVKCPRLLLSPAFPCVVTRHLLSYCARVNDAAVPCSRTFCVHFDEASVFFPCDWCDSSRANKLAAAPCSRAGRRDQADTAANWVAPLPSGQLAVSPDSLSTNSLISPNDLESARAPATRVKTNHETWFPPSLSPHNPRQVTYEKSIFEPANHRHVFFFCPQAARDL